MQPNVVKNKNSPHESRGCFFLNGMRLREDGTAKQSVHNWATKAQMHSAYTARRVASTMRAMKSDPRNLLFLHCTQGITSGRPRPSQAETIIS